MCNAFDNNKLGNDKEEAAALAIWPCKYEA
jgi:hypothetical protein